MNASLSCLRRDTDAENDGGVNNDPEVRSFLASVIGNGHGQAPRVPAPYNTNHQIVPFSEPVRIPVRLILKIRAVYITGLCGPGASPAGSELAQPRHPADSTRGGVLAAAPSIC